ncbi:MAG: hypothetical protein A3A44_01175 [Candidatus Sungbacteria bacterium RIFCSPLOWO2_01_FULL_60_25]|uniref:Uncharacterized protein n=1 Tax=Candidatus Sungbacteria bacterium RIFCSPLOWO2_01_FULL_60_25 TaxID=1802281 RepID=A0A1G2LH94_9BACT|nr:MAG: hypothetical protein A3A44_01175 [Candidatus Sungbacteria bacterium RIFCSPLOWO2_01_FULL_60_25]
MLLGEPPLALRAHAKVFWCGGEDAVEFGGEEVLGGFLGFGAQALGLLNLPQQPPPSLACPPSYIFCSK